MSKANRVNTAFNNGMGNTNNNSNAGIMIDDNKFKSVRSLNLNARANSEPPSEITSYKLNPNNNAAAKGQAVPTTEPANNELS